jgi:DNA invertase Pin-like site-specific DNA recombinase
MCIIPIVFLYFCTLKVKMARIGYARVSTVGQNLDMQIAALEKSDCDRIFVEKVSGVKERPQLQAALKYMRAGDTLIVYKFDRIGRSLKDLVNIFADLQKRDIGLISLNDNIDASSNSGKFMMNVFAALAEFERTIIIERCQAGREEAKRKGKQFGRPKGIPKDKIAACSSLYNSGLTITAIQKQLNIKSKSTVYRLLRLNGIEPSRK